MTTEQNNGGPSDDEIRRLVNLPFNQDENGTEWVTLTPQMLARAVRRALATTEPEPTGMPELPPLPRCMYPNMQHQRMYIGNVYTADQVKAYGEQCWKAGYKHGAWGDKPEPTGKQSLQVEPAVNQQLTTEPVDEREAFEREMAKPPFEFCMDRWPDDGAYAWPGNYAAYHTQCAWVAWRARAAMAQGVKG